MKTVSLTLEEPPDMDERIIYSIVSELFDVDIEFKRKDIIICGRNLDVIAWLAFHVLPLDTGES
ncbi:MAG: hypothetical protein GOVbin1923_57 [Prokaryotic dsDNA virus sp.]|nr:MAG: hypothetical protein GOVbin1923_57 [Prokaryotic dsDNA virus sp.]|tara:strand:- start:5374 stop:5565 length:192 start_codon:yes stop_codon:yes gene_type:complete